jgi:hypothetical protein
VSTNELPKKTKDFIGKVKSNKEFLSLEVAHTWKTERFIDPKCTGFIMEGLNDLLKIIENLPDFLAEDLSLTLTANHKDGMTRAGIAVKYEGPLQRARKPVPGFDIPETIEKGK